ncbi:MAG: FAD-dependent oxidoreductase [Gemmatimonadales bacterium]
MTVAEPVDVLVIGAGPAGLSAACAARDAGKSVLVVDQAMRAGGQVWRHRDEGNLPAVARQWIERSRAAGVRFRLSGRVIDGSWPHGLVIESEAGVEVLRPAALVIAAGARERFLPFPGWTLPGVVGVGGLQALIKNGLDIRGSRVIIAGTGPLLFPVAATVARLGGDLLLVAEQATRTHLIDFAARLIAKPSAIRQAIAYRWRFRKTPLRTGYWVVAAHGDGQLREVTIHGPRGERRVACDWLAVAAGLIPNVEIAALLGCTIEAGAVRVDDVQATSVAGVFAAGECTGVKGDDAALAEGTIAGYAAAGDRNRIAASVRSRRNAGRAFGAAMASTFAPRPELAALADDDTVICRCEGVRRGEIDARWSQRQAKLWTRVGMGECQGAVCGPACGILFGWSANAVRPPLGAPVCGAWRAGLTIDDGPRDGTH